MNENNDFNNIISPSPPFSHFDMVKQIEFTEMQNWGFWNGYEAQSKEKPR